jgi:hypothetical protein
MSEEQKIFKVGDIVLIKERNFRGRIVAVTPIENVSVTAMPEDELMMYDVEYPDTGQLCIQRGLFRPELTFLSSKKKAPKKSTTNSESCQSSTTSVKESDFKIGDNVVVKDTRRQAKIIRTNSYGSFTVVEQDGSLSEYFPDDLEHHIDMEDKVRYWEGQLTTKDLTSAFVRSVTREDLEAIVLLLGEQLEGKQRIVDFRISVIESLHADKTKLTDDLLDAKTELRKLKDDFERERSIAEKKDDSFEGLLKAQLDEYAKENLENSFKVISDETAQKAFSEVLNPYAMTREKVIETINKAMEEGLTGYTPKGGDES